MKATVYELICKTTGARYIGSTTKTLKERLNGHKNKYNEWLQGKRTFTTSFDIIKNGNYYINTLENVDFENKKELLERERFFIENSKCINKSIPVRFNRQDKLNQRKQYRLANKEKIREYAQKYRLRKKEEKMNLYQKGI